MDEDYKHYDLFSKELMIKKDELLDEKYGDGYSQSINEETKNNHNIFYYISPYEDLSDIFNTSKQLFNSDLKHFPNNPKKLNLIEVRNCYYLLYEIPGIFNNLSSLVVEESIITLEVFQFLLDNLKSLKNVELDFNTFLKRKQKNNNNVINWPTNLKSIKYYVNEISYIDDEERVILYDGGVPYDLKAFDFKITPSFLPNLISLSYKQRRGINDVEFLEFLNLNPHIKELKVNFDYFEPEILYTIGNLQNLTSLSLINYHYYNIGSLESINLPIPINLKHLHLCLRDDPGILHLTQQFPNIKQLIIDSKSIKFNHLCEFIKNFTELKTLKLITSLKENNINQYSIPSLDNLEFLELELDYFDQFEESKWDFLTCQNLKRIKFTKVNEYKNFELPKLSRRFLKNWKLNYSPIELILYRI